MKLKALMFALLLSVALHAQTGGARYDSNVFTAAGNVPVGAQAPMYTLPYSMISICASPATPASGSACTNTVPIFSDQALSMPITQPITSDSQGRYGFWIAPGTYTYSIVSPSGAYLGTSPITFGSGGIKNPRNLSFILSRASAQSIALKFSTATTAGYTVQACPGSYPCIATSSVATNATTTLKFAKNGTTFCTATFAAGSTTGTFSGCTQTAFTYTNNTTFDTLTITWSGDLTSVPAVYLTEI